MFLFIIQVVPRGFKVRAGNRHNRVIIPFFVNY